MKYFSTNLSQQLRIRIAIIDNKLNKVTRSQIVLNFLFYLKKLIIAIFKKWVETKFQS